MSFNDVTLNLREERAYSAEKYHLWDQTLSCFYSTFRICKLSLFLHFLLVGWDVDLFRDLTWNVFFPQKGRKYKSLV